MEFNLKTITSLSDDLKRLDEAAEKWKASVSFWTEYYVVQNLDAFTDSGREKTSAQIVNLSIFQDEKWECVVEKPTTLSLRLINPTLYSVQQLIPIMIKQLSNPPSEEQWNKKLEEFENQKHL